VSTKGHPTLKNFRGFRVRVLAATAEEITSAKHNGLNK
jgi:hypothetical protein